MKHIYTILGILVNINLVLLIQSFGNKEGNIKRIREGIIEENLECINGECTIYIKLGDQSFALNIEFEQKWSWVPTDQCTGFSGCYYPTKYNLTSNTAHFDPSDNNVQIQGYRMGEEYLVNGMISSNMFVIGGIELFPTLYLSVSAANYSTIYAAGVLSLSLGAYIPKGHNSVIGAMEKSEKINEAVVGLDISFNAFQDEGAYGSITFGSYSQRDNLVWEDCKLNSMWSINITAYRVGNYYKKYPLNGQQIAKINPAFRNIGIPKSEYLHFINSWKQICNKQLITPCQINSPDYSLFPIITFISPAKNTFQLNPQDYLSITSSANGKYDIFFYVEEGETEYWELGIPFIKRYYIVLDFGKSNIGFDDNKEGKYMDPATKSYAELAWFLAILFLLGFLILECYIMVFK